MIYDPLPKQRILTQIVQMLLKSEENKNNSFELNVTTPSSHYGIIICIHHKNKLNTSRTGIL